MDEQLFISTKPSPDIILTIKTETQSTYKSSTNINMPGGSCNGCYGSGMDGEKACGLCNGSGKEK
jgi:hypothetical protein